MNNPTRIKFRRYGRYWRSTACLVVAVVLLLSCLAGCSGEVYDPDRGALTLPSSPSQDETGKVLELPEADPYGDSAHVLRADFLETGKSDAILLRVGVPILGDSKVFAVKYLPFCIVPQLIHCSDDCSEGSSPIVVEKPFDIFGE